MLVVLRQGGLEGGLNFDAKVRRESTDLEDLFIAHIGGMDAFARGLEVAHALLTDSPWEQWRTQRYASFDSGKGKDFESGALGLAELAALATQLGEPKQISGKQERYENLLNQYLLR
jgi:xylose isomerase